MSGFVGRSNEGVLLDITDVLTGSFELSVLEDLGISTAYFTVPVFHPSSHVSCELVWSHNGVHAAVVCLRDLHYDVVLESAFR